MLGCVQETRGQEKENTETGLRLSLVTWGLEQKPGLPRVPRENQLGMWFVVVESLNVFVFQYLLILFGCTV